MTAVLVDFNVANKVFSATSFRSGSLGVKEASLVTS